jgi:hypothetical protein
VQTLVLRRILFREQEQHCLAALIFVIQTETKI